MDRKSVCRHLGSFNIAGFAYWDGYLAFQELKVGRRLRLEREESNRFDPYAVAIYYEGYKLGYIPREENMMVCQFLDLGYAGIFDMRVERLSPDAHPEKQVYVRLSLKFADEVYKC